MVTNVEVFFPFGCCDVNFIMTDDLFIALKLIGYCIFLWLEPQNSIACHQTYIYGSVDEATL